MITNLANQWHRCQINEPECSDEVVDLAEPDPVKSVNASSTNSTLRRTMARSPPTRSAWAADRSYKSRVASAFLPVPGKDMSSITSVTHQSVLPLTATYTTPRKASRPNSTRAASRAADPSRTPSPEIVAAPTCVITLRLASRTLTCWCTARPRSTACHYSAARSGTRDTS